MNERQALTEMEKIYMGAAWIEDRGRQYPYVHMTAGYRYRYQVGRKWLGIPEILGEGDNWQEAVECAKSNA